MKNMRSQYRREKVKDGGKGGRGANAWVFLDRLRFLHPYVLPGSKTPTYRKVRSIGSNRQHQTGNRQVVSDDGHHEGGLYYCIISFIRVDFYFRDDFANATLPCPGFLCMAYERIVTPTNSASLRALISRLLGFLSLRNAKTIPTTVWAPMYTIVKTDRYYLV